MNNTSIPNQVIDTIIELDDEICGRMFKAVIAALRHEPTDRFEFTGVNLAIFCLILAFLKPIIRRRERDSARRAACRSANHAPKAASKPGNDYHMPPMTVAPDATPYHLLGRNDLPEEQQTELDEWKMKTIIKQLRSRNFPPSVLRQQLLEFIRSEFGNRYADYTFDSRGNVRLVKARGYPSRIT